MILIQQFNEKLNTTSDNRFSFWHSYRNQIEKYVASLLCQMNDKENALIVGFGNGDDIPLKYFLNQFKQVTLMDVDLINMKQGMKKHALRNKEEEKVELCKLEFTGLSSLRFFTELIELMNQNSSMNQIKQFIDDAIQKINLFSWINELHTKFDFIFVSPIYTQLVYQQVVIVLNQFPQYQILKDYFLTKMTEIINLFNNNLLSVSKEKAIIFVLSDIFEVIKDTPFFNQILNSISDFQEMELLHQNYIKTYGYGLGDFGLLSLENKTKKIADNWLIWPFNEEKIMIVKMNVFRTI